MKLDLYRQSFGKKKQSNIKFNESPSSGSHVPTCRQTDVTKLTVGLCNFVNTPKNELSQNVFIFIFLTIQNSVAKLV